MAIYVFVAFGWWTVLHLRNNETFFKNNVEIIKLRNPNLSLAQIENSEAFKALADKFIAKNRMIYGESLVFLSFMLFGTIWIYNRHKKEEAFALQQQNFLHSVSHELKSPLSGIKLSLETMQSRELEKPMKDRILKNSMSEVNRLNLLINNILLSAQLGNSTLEISKQPIEVKSLISSIIKRLKQQYPERVVVCNSDELTLETDQWMLESVLINLVENALKYSKKNTTVEVKTYQNNGKNYIAVLDNGSGISDKDKKQIFKKFYRAGNEMTRSAKGTGLGLFIVSELVKTMHGEIKLTDNSPNGSVFTLVL